MAKLCRGPAIVGRVFRRQSQVVDVGHSARENRRGSGEIATPGCLLGIGSIAEEIVVILYRLQREHIPAETGGLRDPAHAVEAELYIRAFAVVEEAARSKHHLLAA